MRSSLADTQRQAVDRTFDIHDQNTYEIVRIWVPPAQLAKANAEFTEL